MQKKERQTVRQQRIQQRKEQRIQQEQKEINECIFCVKVIKSSTSKVDCNSEEGVSQKTEHFSFQLFLSLLDI